METSENAEVTTSSQLTSSAEDFPARTSATPASVQESGESEADCGAKCTESFASYDPDTHSLRTSQLSLGLDLNECFATLPLSGLMRSGNLYQRGPLVPNISGTGYSWLPTPTTKANQSSPSMAKNGAGCRRAILEHPESYKNPTWVEWLMGYPSGWTALED